MPAITREQLVQYLKNLETKVKQYQKEIEQRDAEIARLRGDIKILTGTIESLLARGSQPTPVLEKPEPSYQPAPKFSSIAKILEEPPKEAIKKEPAAKTILHEKSTGETKPIQSTSPPKIASAPKSAEAAKLVFKPVDSVKEPDSVQPAEELPAEDLPVEIEAAPEISVYKPSVNFKTGQFLSAVIDGEEEADEIKCLLERLETCESDQRRSVLVSLTSVYWRMTVNMAKRLVNENLSWEKRLCMRYGMLDEKLMSDRMPIWEQLYLDKSRPNDSGIYYIDEWYEAILRDELRYSSIDEFALNGAKPDLKAVGEQALAYEILSVPQMQRFCVGPRSNLVAILVQDYCMPTHENPIVSRKWLSETMPQIVQCDYKLFHRKYKGEERTVQPLFIICPGYGLLSGCWEPYTPGRKRDSGPRIPICMFPPRSSIRILLMGVSDYRWEYAKADAMHYWMTEGLTGKWYGIFSRREQRKDLKEDFRDCYYHWVINESRAVPRLNKREREFLWYNCPFSDEVKLKLKGSALFGDLIELEEAKRQREQAEQQELERIKAEREVRKAKRLAEQQS